MIDLSKKYRTRDGRKVELKEIDGGSSYPVLGRIDKRNHDDVWRLDGSYLGVGQGRCSLDLIEVTEPTPQAIILTEQDYVSAVHDTSPPKRKVVQIAIATVSQDPQREYYTERMALCDDGAIFLQWGPNSAPWHRLPPIPQEGIE